MDYVMFGWEDAVFQLPGSAFRRSVIPFILTLLQDEYAKNIGKY